MRKEFDPNENLNILTSPLLSLSVNHLPDILDGATDYRPYANLIADYSLTFLR